MTISASSLEKKFSLVLKILSGQIPNASDPESGILILEANDGSSHTLFGRNYRNYEAIIDDVLKDRSVARNFDRKEVDGKVRSSFKSLLAKSSQERLDYVKDTVDDLIRDLRKEFADWLVVLPIENLELDQPVNLGLAKLYPAGRNIDNWKRRFSYVLERTKNRSEAKTSMREFVDRELDTYILNNPYVVVKVESRGKRATEFALDKAETAVNILRFLEEQFGLQHPDHTGFGVVPIFRSRRQFGFQFSEDFSRWSLGSKWVGPIVAQTFTKENLTRMKRSGVYKRLNELLLKRQRSEMENRLLSAITWFGEAKVELIPCIRFLKYIVAIESLLSYPKQDQHEGRITANVSERLAFLVCRGRDPIARFRIRTDMERLYRIRSAVVHEGLKQISEEDLRHAKKYSGAAIYHLLKKPAFKSAQDLAGWVNYQKMR